MLDNNFLDNDLLDNNSLAYIDSNIDIDINIKLKPDENITSRNFLEKNSWINIKDLFQQVQDQTAYEKLTRDVLK